MFEFESGKFQYLQEAMIRELGLAKKQAKQQV